MAVLRRRIRSDHGTYRGLSAALAAALHEQHREHPSWSYQLHAGNLVALAEKKPELGRCPSYACVARYMKSHGWFKRPRRGPVNSPGARAAEARFEAREVRSFECEYVNGLWHLDFHHGSRRVLPADGAWAYPILLAILDDRSRLCCHAQWYLSEGAEELCHGLSQALQKRVLPRALLHDICATAGVCFESLPLEVITAPVLRLDTVADRERLAKTVELLRPRLLILDPMIRLHRLDENDASQIAVLLSYLRELQRRFQVAVGLVHHARKDSNRSRPGQALRGSSELHGWGDSNLYMRRRGQRLTLTTEHRAAPSQDDIPLQLTEAGAAVSLSVVGAPADDAPAEASPLVRVRQALQQLGEPAPVSRIRQHCGMRMASVCESLAELLRQGIVAQDARGYRLTPATAA